MNHIHRRPDVGVRIVRPRYESSTYVADHVVSFVPRVASINPDDKESDALLGYSYEESVSGPESPFSLSFAAQPLAGGESIMDIIQPMDLVFIHEFGLDRYCGVVHQVRYTARLSDAGPQRSIVVTGSGIGELLASFGLIMNYYLWAGGPSSDMANTALKVELAANKNASLREVLAIIYQRYIGLATTVPDTGATVSGVRSILAEFMDLEGDGSSLVSHYPLAIRFFQQGVNSIWDIWKSILPPPLYELFGKWIPATSGGKYRVYARKCPFSPADWKALPVGKIAPLALIDYSIGNDDSDAATFFYASMPGSELSEKDVLAIDHYRALRKADSSKWPKYGYRPMTATLRYYKRDDSGSTQSILEDAAKTMVDWYSENDRFLSGRITHISVDDSEHMQYVGAGSRISFVGGEFYVVKVSRSWTYGGSPMTTLDVTRGFRYSPSGDREGPIRELGKRFKELES